MSFNDEIDNKIFRSRRCHYLKYRVCVNTPFKYKKKAMEVIYFKKLKKKKNYSNVSSSMESRSYENHTRRVNHALYLLFICCKRILAGLGMQPVGVSF